MKKAALHNLGCKVNAYETEAMQHLLEEAGYEIVPFTQKADVYVINTCSVTNMADRKSRQMLHKAKKNNPDSIVVAAGCYVQTSEKEVLNDLSVDIVIGNDRKHDLVRLLEEYSLDSVNDTVDDINDGKHDFEELFIDQTKEHTRAFIKVQDGCNQFCSYCIIPSLRGNYRSLPMEELLKEAELLAEEAAEEEPAKSTWEQKYIEGLLWGAAAVLLLLLLIGVGVYIYQNFAGGGRYEKG